ncbi:MAG: FKBP-type peptidyl-prolyl cis-trans isomerase [Planctomycetota bacterium]
MAEDAEKQKDLPSGAKYQVVEEGTGPTAEANEAVAFSYAVFDTEGKLMDCSAWQNGRKISGTSSNLPFPFLKDLVAIMKQGDVVRVRVPAGVVSNFKGDSIWLLTLDGVHRLPKFRQLDPEKTVTTQSGLKYEVIQQGTGERPKASDTVSAMYTGWLTDGTMFDSAHARGMAADFPLNGVIKGWTEGLQLMNVGGSFLFEIPAELGYGVRGSPPKIGPNATLIFLVELVDVK